MSSSVNKQMLLKVSSFVLNFIALMLSSGLTQLIETRSIGKCFILTYPSKYWESYRLIFLCPNDI